MLSLFQFQKWSAVKRKGKKQGSIMTGLLAGASIRSGAIKKSEQASYRLLRRVTSQHYRCRLLAAAPSGASQAFCRRQNLGGGGIHFRRAFQSPKGGAPLCGVELKKKDTTTVVSFFLAVVVGFEPPPAKPLRRKGFTVFINVKSPILEPTFHELLHSFIQ